MSDKKLTDNEIIKALECCIDNTDKPCSECAYSNCDYNCVDELQKNVLALINHLQAENERLKNNITTLTRSISELTAEVERQRKDKKDAFLLAADIVNADKIVRAEAYKEYHTKAKACLKANRDIEQQIGNTYAAKTIKEIENRFDNILKELVGDTDA